MSEPVRVRRVEIKGLFDLYDHAIDVRLADRVTILHGPNGIGKTALLRMLAAALAADVRTLAAKPFQTLRLDLTDGRTLEVSPSWGKRSGWWPPPILVFRVTGTDVPHEVAVWARSEEPPRGGPNNPDGPVVTTDALPEWLRQLQSEMPVRLIETQRLLTPGALPQPTVDWIAANLKERIWKSLTAYANEAQKHSRTFLQRVLRAGKEHLPTEELEQRIQRLQGELQRLNRIGLVQSAESGTDVPLTDAELRGADSTKLTMMTQYLIDQEVALETVRELADRVELLEKAIGSKVLDKSIDVGQKGGILARNRRGVMIPLSDLSSGEQHEIVLFYNLLFLCPTGTWVLIDEPEISMHILWQKQFVTDVIDIARLVKLDVLIATHSPFIADERTDLLVPLTTEAA